MSDSARRFRIEGGSSRAAVRMPVPPFPLPDTLELGGSDMAATTGASEISAPIIEELRALRSIVAPLRGIIENLSENYRNELRSVTNLRSDIGEIDEAIRGTKKELAAIKVGANIGGVDIAALELTTVVSQTEQATNDILAASESIETLAGAIQSDTTLEDAKARAAEIAEKVTVIYMACNFQDLSGQRVSRVVDTLNFVESRIHRMIDAWGGLQALHDLIEAEITAKEEEKATEGTAALLTGPVPVNSEDHVDQSEIDALFS
jgi:chemotaxis protein CheZ